MAFFCAPTFAGAVSAIHLTSLSRWAHSAGADENIKNACGFYILCSGCFVYI
jgi:hypothetical protein